MKLYQDMNHKKEFKGSNTTSLKKAGFANGEQVFVPGKA